MTTPACLSRQDSATAASVGIAIASTAGTHRARAETRSASSFLSISVVGRTNRITMISSYSVMPSSSVQSVPANQVISCPMMTVLARRNSFSRPGTKPSAPFGECRISAPRQSRSMSSTSSSRPSSVLAEAWMYLKWRIKVLSHSPGI